MLSEDLELFAVLNERIFATEGLIEKLSAQDQKVRFLARLPGVGDFLSVLICYEVENIKRFSRAKKFTGYTGPVPSTYASGNRMVHGSLTKQGNNGSDGILVKLLS